MISVLGILALLLVAMSGLVVAQQQVSVEARVKPILTIDGLQFKDLNANGVLDPYEDWRLPVDDRVDDLISQMTLEEKVGLMFHMNTGAAEVDDKTVAWIVESHVTHWLDNQSGTPDFRATVLNEYQEIAEGTRLGVPITFSADRAYNVWSGMIDMPHWAFGTAHDPKLAAQIFDVYSREMRAAGYHLTLHPSGVEVFQTRWGENHEWVAALVKAYVSAYTWNGMQVCLKHFPTNGYAAARSPAALLENYMLPWQTGIYAGAAFIMLTNRQGLSGATAAAHFDEPTLTYLRQNLGYDGVVLTDWMHSTSGVTTDGIAPADLTIAERLEYYMRIGIDQLGGSRFNPSQLVDVVRSGSVAEARIDESARRILKTKFELGLFDDPYVDPGVALQIAASAKYLEERFDITDIYTLEAARSPRAAALDRALQVSSSVLLVNDGALPLKDGVALYVLGAEEEGIARESAALSRYATIVDDLARAEVAVVRIANFRDQERQLISTSIDAGVPTIVAIDSSSIADYSWLVGRPNIAAVLLMSYNANVDHGTSLPGFYRRVNPEVLADMLFGRASPTGGLSSELPRSQDQLAEQWGDVPFDLGATTEARMQIVTAIRTGQPVPMNLGDPLFPYGFGLQYNLYPQFEYSVLVLPRTVQQGEPFVVSCLLQNLGHDGYTNVWVTAEQLPVGSKFMAVRGGMSRVVNIPIVLPEPGTFTITVGPLSGSVEVLAR